MFQLLPFLFGVSRKPSFGMFEQRPRQALRPAPVSFGYVILPPFLIMLPVLAFASVIVENAFILPYLFQQLLMLGEAFKALPFLLAVFGKSTLRVSECCRRQRLGPAAPGCIFAVTQFSSYSLSLLPVLASSLRMAQL